MPQGGLPIVLPLVLYFCALVFVGILSGIIARRKAQSIDFDEDFYLGNRKIGGVRMAFTTVATVISAGTVIAASGVGYKNGFNWIYTALALQIGLGFVNLGTLGKKFAIIGRRIKAITMLDFLKARYEDNKFIVIGGAIVILAFMGTYMMAQIQGGARVLQTITGLSYTSGLFIFATIILIYVVIGGFKAVVNTDTFQGIFMIIGAVALWLFGLQSVGGFSGLRDGLVAINPDMLTIPGPGDLGSTAYSVTYFLHIAFCMIVVPPAVTRAMSYKSSKDLHRAISVGAVIGFIFSISYGFFGVLTAVLIPGIDVGDKAVPSLYMHLFNPWIAGILLAAPFAAMITTVDSILLSLASTIAKDIYQNYIVKNANQKQIKNVSLISVIGIMVLFTIIAITPPDFIQWVVQFGLGGLGAAFSAPLVLGLFWQRANKQGTIAGMIAGVFAFIIFNFVLKLPLMKQTPAMAVSYIVMVIVSLMTAPPSERVIRIFWGRDPVEDKPAIDSGSPLTATKGA